MLQERMRAIAEEIGEVESLQELKALWAFGQVNNNEYGDAACIPHFKDAVARLRNQVKEEVPMETMNLEARIAELLAQVEALKGNPPVQAPSQPIVRGSKRYRLLSTDVSWSTKSQVGAIAAILAAHAKVGDVLQEDHIIQMMEANVEVLQTRQGGKRVWKYYRGNHAEGLEMHGNIVEVL